MGALNQAIKTARFVSAVCLVHLLEALASGAKGQFLGITHYADYQRYFTHLRRLQGSPEAPLVIEHRMSSPPTCRCRGALHYFETIR